FGLMHAEITVGADALAIALQPFAREDQVAARARQLADERLLHERFARRPAELVGIQFAHTDQQEAHERERVRDARLGPRAELQPMAAIRAAHDAERERRD